MVQVPESGETGRIEESAGPRIDEIDETLAENLKLGEDLRFVLVCVGGGAARIGREIAQRHLRYVETIAINCDPRVQNLEEFDRRVFLGVTPAGSCETNGSPAVGGHLARAAEPALDRLFVGATFVTVVASLGGGTGTGVLPFVLESAARRAAVLSVFAIKPFRCEGERRALADRSLARLHFVDAWVEKLQSHLATLTVLDNESLVAEAARLPMNRLNHAWSELIATHIEKAFVMPAEAAVDAGRLGSTAEPEAPVRPEPTDPATSPVPGPLSPDGPIAPMLPTLLPGGYPPLAAGGPSLGDAELTFEIVDAGPRGPELP